MPVLQQIAYFQNRRDEVPNQQLAQALAAQQYVAGIQEIAQNLWHENPAVQSDCLKVLYESISPCGNGSGGKVTGMRMTRTCLPASPSTFQKGSPWRRLPRSRLM